MDSVKAKILELPQAPEPDHSLRAVELGEFLRTRRESLDPARLGLPRFARRRTPGLRREEVAQLADIGITWYTKLEQGRSVRASPKVLAAIAKALQCSESEMRYLFTLAGHGVPTQSIVPLCEGISRCSQILLDQLDPLPAILGNARFDILGFNRAYCHLVGVDLESIAKSDRNCIYLALTHPAWRASLADWDDALPRMVALFRAAMAEHRFEPLWEAQLNRFMAVSEAFRDVWQRNEVRGIENQIKRFKHPKLGILNLQQTNWWTAPKNGDRLLVYVPVDEHSTRSLQSLSEHTGA